MTSLVQKVAPWLQGTDTTETSKAQRPLSYIRQFHAYIQNP